MLYDNIIIVVIRKIININSSIVEECFTQII